MSSRTVTSVDGTGKPTVPSFGLSSGLMQTTGDASVKP